LIGFVNYDPTQQEIINGYGCVTHNWRNGNCYWRIGFRIAAGREINYFPKDTNVYKSQLNEVSSLNLRKYTHNPLILNNFPLMVFSAMETGCGFTGNINPVEKETLGHRFGTERT
jgi:hypothetical protein